MQQGMGKQQNRSRIAALSQLPGSTASVKPLQNNRTAYRRTMPKRVNASSDNIAGQSTTHCAPRRGVLPFGKWRKSVQDKIQQD